MKNNNQNYKKIYWNLDIGKTKWKQSKISNYFHFEIALNSFLAVLLRNKKGQTAMWHNQRCWKSSQHMNNN